MLEHYYRHHLGGAEIQAFLLMQYFKGNTLSYLKYGKDIPKQPLIDDGIRIYSLKKPLGNVNFLNTFKRRAIQNILERIDADIYYQRGMVFCDAVQEYSKTHDKTFIYPVSGERQCLPNRPSFSRSGMLDYVNGLCKENVIKNADVVVSQNLSQRDLLEKNFGVKSVVIPNGHVVPDQPLTKDTPPVVAWIGNLKEIKQPELFIALAGKCRDLDVKFIFAGKPGKERYQARLMREMETLTNIEYLGKIPFQLSNDLLSRSSIFVNTSKHEGFPNTFIQAWLRETPVVSLHVDPNDVLKQRRCGILSGSFPALVEDVRYLIEHPDMRIAMGKRSRQFAVDNYDINITGGKYRELFETTLRGENGTVHADNRMMDSRGNK